MMNCRKFAVLLAISCLTVGCTERRNQDGDHSSADARAVDPGPRPQLDTHATVKDITDEEFTFDEFRELFRNSVTVLGGQFVEQREFSKNGTGVTPQFLLEFEEGFDVHRGFVQTHEDGGRKCQLMVYLGDEQQESQLDHMEAGNRYVVFFPKAFDRHQAVCFAETEFITHTLKTWKTHGTYEDDELTALEDSAAIVVTAETKEEICLESYPCQHSWHFKVLTVHKGDKVPADIKVEGSYKDHTTVPDPLKPPSGTVKLFLKQGDGNATDVLAAIPAR